MIHLAKDVPRTVRLETMPEPGSFDYGFVVWAGTSGLGDPWGDLQHEPQILDYDDNETVCSCGEDGCTLYLAEESGESDAIRHDGGHHANNARICALTADRNRYLVLDDLWHPVAKLPDDFKPPIRTYKSSKDGYVYVIALNPDLSLHRLKVGWTKDIREREKSFRTTSPNLLLLALIETYEPGEQVAQSLCGNQIRNSEVFDVLDPWETLRKIHQALEVFNTQHEKRLREMEAVV